MKPSFLLARIGSGKPWTSFRAGFRLVVLLFGGMVLGGCSVNLPFLDKDGKTEPQVYFVGVESLRLYEEPGYSGNVVADLEQYQKVYRYQLEKGFARVKVDDTGATGWVDNAKLIWRLPETGVDETSGKAPAASSPPSDEAQEAATREDETDSTTRSEPASPGVDPTRFDPF